MARWHSITGRSAPPELVLAAQSMSDFEKTPPDVKELLAKPISQLGLRLEGSPVERFVHRLYRELDRPVPFSRKYVRHIAGWYAQKHPDEDFAETFAVWLTPRSNWRRKYKLWPALAKLRYVDSAVRKVRDHDPAVPNGNFDITVEDMKVTVAEFYQRMQ